LKVEVQLRSAVEGPGVGEMASTRPPGQRRRREVALQRLTMPSEAEQAEVHARQ
jgi:hypothetical protein